MPLNIPVTKIWGTTTPLVLMPTFEMHRLDIKPRHACSQHVHGAKINTFHVLDGDLYIDEWGAELDGVLVHWRLNAGETFTVKAGIIHRFRTGPEPCKALEMYYPAALSEDIRRFDVGHALG